MFNIHGEWKIEVCNNVVVQYFSGCWNEEAIIAYVKDFRVNTAPLIGTTWAIISFFDDWELGVPEITAHVEEHCQWFKANGCVKDCHVYSPNAAKEMQLERLIPQTEGAYERQVFSNVNHAVNWLASHGFIVKHSVMVNEEILKLTS